MSFIKKTALVFLLLFASILFVSCRENTKSPEKALDNFSQQISEGKTNGMSLTIYYKNPEILTPYPLDVCELIRLNDFKIVVKDKELKNYINVLSQINSKVIIPVETDEKMSYVEARIYYIFKDRFGRKMFDVVMWSGQGNIFVNGIEVEECRLFYDVIIPFLPEDIADVLEALKP